MLDKIAKIIMEASNIRKMFLPNHCDFTASMFNSFADQILALEVEGWLIRGKCDIMHPDFTKIVPETCADCDGTCNLYIPSRPSTLQEIIDGKAVRV